MKIIVAVVLLGLVALTMAQGDQCTNNADCAAHCHPHSGTCHNGVCHCTHQARQVPCEGHTCVCPDGTDGHCDHNGVCHCHS